jgi:hypothetical protein
MVVYNVRGSVQALKALVIEGYVVEDRFSPTDWNFKLEDDEVDDFLEDCDCLSLEAELI